MMYFQEPWRIDDFGNILSKNNELIIETYNFYGDEKKTSRRIVDCVNACTGIPDEVLAGAKHYGVDPLLAEIERLEAEIADLKKYIIEELRDYVSDELEYHIAAYGHNYKVDRIKYYQDELEKIDKLKEGK